MKISDFKGLFNKSILSIVDIENVHDDYYKIVLKPEKNISWIPGDHGVFTLRGKKFKGKKFRAFSLASSPTEKVVIIGTRTGKNISNFKKELISMEKGERVNLRGPFGWFKVKDNTSPIVMIAGGVGITPMRALFVQLQNEKTRPIDLIFASSDFYMFNNELTNISNINDSISIYKTENITNTKNTIDTLSSKYKSSAYYYISGSRTFIKEVKKQLKKTGIKSKRIINDPFFGY